MSLDKLKIEELAGNIFSVLDTNRNALLNELYIKLDTVKEHTGNESPIHLLMKGKVTKEIVRSQIEYVIKGENQYTSFFPGSSLLPIEDLTNKELVRKVLLGITRLIRDFWHLDCTIQTLEDNTFLVLPYSFYADDIWNSLMKGSFIGVETSEVPYVRWSNCLQSFINPLELGRQLAKDKLQVLIKQLPSITERLESEDIKLGEELLNSKSNSKALRKKKHLVSTWLLRLSSHKSPKFVINSNCYFKPTSLFGNEELDSDKLVYFGYLQMLKWEVLDYLGGRYLESEILNQDEDYFIAIPILPCEFIKVLQLEAIAITESVENFNVYL